jgi:hypothetical protein
VEENMLKLQKAITLAMFVAASALMSTAASAQASDR